MAAGITIVLLDRVGRFQARVEGPVSGNVLLRRQQYRASDAPDEIVGSIVCGKTANQRTVFKERCAIIARRSPVIEGKRSKLPSSAWEISCSASLFSNGGAEIFRGAEGEAAYVYFGVFNGLIRAPEGEMAFRGRSRRPPLDPMNALLSFPYTLLTHDCRSAAEKSWPRSGGWAFFIGTGLAAQASLSTLWKNCGQRSPIGSLWRSSTGGKFWRKILPGRITVPSI
jgi:CRISP-associated protein Cas1